MKLLVLYFILFFSFESKGQCDKLMVGHWQVIAAFNGEVYFNLKTDSIFISPEMKEMYPDSASQKTMVSVAKELYGTTNFLFDKNGIYKLYMDTSFQFEGPYCYKPAKNILTLASKNSLGEMISEESNARIEKGLLYISQKWDDERTIDLVLEKRK